MANIGRDNFSSYKFHNRKEVVTADKFYPTPDYTLAIKGIIELFKKIKSVSFIFRKIDYNYLSSHWVGNVEIMSHPRIDEINETQFTIYFESYNKIEFRFGSNFYLMKQIKGNTVLWYKEIPEPPKKESKNEPIAFDSAVSYSFTFTSDEQAISDQYSKVTSDYQCAKIEKKLSDKLNKILGESLPINDAQEFFQY